MVQIQGQHSPATRPPGVLIVDDDAAVRAMLAIGFGRFGFNVWPAADCQAALDTFRANRNTINVALLDVQMSGRDGPATLTDLRAIDPHLPACFMTGNTGSYCEQDLFDLGAHAVFWKPIALLEVIERLRVLASSSVEPAGVVR